MIGNFNSFELYRLLESLVQLDDSFVDRLKKINHPISSSIVNMMDDNKYIQTDSDLRDTEKIIATEKSDEVNIKRANRPVNPSDIVKIGKLIRKINANFTQEDVSDFVTAYKATSVKEATTPVIVKGEDIKITYLKSNYESEKGDMEMNCMKGEECQPYLNIYVKNPDKVGCVIITNEESKIRARALIWNTDEGDIVMDKIYSTEPELKNVLRDWADENKIVYRAKDDSKPIHSHLFMSNGKEFSKDYTITLNKFEFDTYPYLDTFFYLTDDGVLHNVMPKKEEYRELRNATGTYQPRVSLNWYNFRKAETREEVDEFMRIINCDWYEINNDLSVLAYSDITYMFENLTMIPVTFRFIKGNVTLNNNRLRSLDGLPNEITGNLVLDSNHLDSLEGCPRIIKGDFVASDCYLTTLKGGPEIVTGMYCIQENELKNLDGLATEIGKDLYIFDQRSNAKFTEGQIRNKSNIKGEVVL